MATETAWLIEARDPRYPDCVLPCHFLGIQGGWKFAWMEHANDGLRFARKEDAQKFMMAFEAMADLLPHKETLTGFRSGDPSPIAIEHAWG